MERTTKPLSRSDYEKRMRIAMLEDPLQETRSLKVTTKALFFVQHGAQRTFSLSWELFRHEEVRFCVFRQLDPMMRTFISLIPRIDNPLGRIQPQETPPCAIVLWLPLAFHCLNHLLPVPWDPWQADDCTNVRDGRHIRNVIAQKGPKKKQKLDCREPFEQQFGPKKRMYVLLCAAAV